MSVVDGDATIGGLEVDAVLFHDNGTSDTGVVNVNLGTVDQIIGKFNLSESGVNASEDVKISKITIYNNGNTTNSDISNIDLVAPDGTVLSTVASMDDKYATFDLSDSPYTIPDGTAKTFTLRCDISSGSTRTVKFLIESDYDVVATGVTSGAGILAVADADAADNQGDRSFPIGDRYYHSTASLASYINKVTIASGSLSVSKDTSSPSGNIAVGSTSQTMAVFKVTASGEDMRIEKIHIKITNVTEELSGTVKIQDGAGTVLKSQVASTDALYDGTGYQYTLTTRKTIPAGTSDTIKVIADIKTTATASDTYKVELKNFYTKRMSTGDYVTYASAFVGGNTLTVSTSALTLAKNEAFGSRYEVAGGSKVKIASFVLQAGAAEAANISSMKITIDEDADSANGEITDYTNVIVEKGDGTQLGTTIVSPADTGDTISISGFQIAASASEIINIFVDITSDAVTGEAGCATLGTIGATGAISTSTIATPTATAGQTISWATSGTLTVSTDTSTPVVAVLHASESDVPVLKFILSSTYEAINVTKIILESTKGSANISNVKLYDGTTQVGSTVSLVSGNATFSGLSLQVPKDGAKYMSVKISTTGSGTLKSAESLKLIVSDMEATGAGSGVVIYASGVTTTLSTTAGTCVITADTASDCDVASTTGFATGDLVYFTIYDSGGSVDASGFYTVDSVTDSDTLSVIGHTGIATTTTSQTGKVTRVASSTNTTLSTTAGTCIITADTASGCDVADTSGFATGDLVYFTIYDSGGSVDASGFYTVDSVTDSDTLSLIGHTGIATTTTSQTGRVTKVASSANTTLSTTAGTCVITADTASDCDVASTTGFATGDLVYFTIYDSGGSVDASGFYTVDSVTDSDTLSLIGHTGIATTTTGQTGRVTKVWSLTGTGNPYVLHDVEPTVALNAASPTTGSAATLETVAKFDITADGTRDLVIESITLKEGGSGTGEVGTTTPKIYVGSSLIGTGAAGWTGTAGQSSIVDFTTPYTITAGQTVTFNVKVDTSNISTVNKIFQVYIDGTAGVATTVDTGIDWYYTAASPSPGTEPTVSSPASYCDNYPIYGNPLRY